MASPVLTGLSSPNFYENEVNASPLLFASSVTFTDADNDFDGGTLTVSGLLAEDRVMILDGARIFVDGGVVYHDADGPFPGAAVAIGIVSGGVGATLTVTFNAAATATSIEHLIESLGYANTSDTPTMARTLTINVTDEAGNDMSGPPAYQYDSQPLWNVAQGQAGVRAGFADLDGDGDLDVLVSRPYGGVLYYTNDGTSRQPNWVQQTGADNPFNGVNVQFEPSIAMGDINGDGRADAVFGMSDGTLRYFANTGSGFVETPGMFAGIDVGNDAAPTFGDVDGDGDLDMLVATGAGQLLFYVNGGTAQAPVWQLDEEPLGVFGAIPTFGADLTAAFVDVDGDGDLDVVAGTGAVDGGYVYYLENIGGSQSPTYMYRDDPGSPFYMWSSSAGAAPTAADVDGDGDIDIIFGTDDYNGFDFWTAVNITRGGIELPIYVQPEAEAATPTAGDDILAGTGGDDFMQGLDGDDRLSGGDGADKLKGGAGDDWMDGGNGDDMYVVDSLNDVIDESGDGIDLVQSTVSWTLGANLENLNLAPSGREIDGTGNSLDNLINGNAFANVISGLDGADVLNGNGGADTLYGGADNDVLDGGTQNDYLDGGTGADQMIGGLGNDTFVVDDWADVVVENAVGGTDNILTGLNGFSLMTFGEVENLTLTVMSNFGEGNGLNNVLTGSAVNNELLGLAGADTLYGMDGNDGLYGGAGADRLYGGSGADSFMFEDAADLNNDRIFDLNFAEGDTIHLAWIDGDTNTDGDQALAFVSRFTKVAGQMVMTYNAVSGVTIIKMDVNGDGVSDTQLTLVGDHTATRDNLWTDEGDTDGGWVL